MRIRLSLSKLGPFTTPRPITTTIELRDLGPVRLRSHSTDISVLSELLIGDEISALPNMPDATTVVDLGANIGLSYRWLRRRYPNASFVCVEPDPGNLEMLRRNAGTDCQVVAACVGGHERRVALTNGDGEWGYRMVDASDGTVPVITIDRLLADQALDEIDILKCDIEGAELELFTDCRSWIRRVRAMVVECHLHTTSSDEILSLLDANDSGLEVAHLERQPDLGFELVTLGRQVNMRRRPTRP
jgi:FkbM family methyltransferase